jgi:hypothetical protein
VELRPELSLAFILRANPGAYALLLGSGVSVGVVPTGWDILNDLVKKGDDPFAWYQQEFGHQPRYDDVLDALTSTPEERVGLLRPYFERTVDEDSTDIIQPAPAHRAVAKLNAMGLVRVVITTNFDRLLERALDEVNVAPTVLATPSGVEGAKPLHQQDACVIKLHGDYLDPRFLNTGSELATYPEATNRLLDQVFDEYGLVVAGWSATWDPALRAAIERCKTRRYGSFWVEPFALSEAAQSLVTLRDSRVVAASADDFFTRLLDSVTALSDIDRPNPVAVAVTVANTKRYLQEGQRIRLHDLVADEFARAREGIGSWPLNESNADALQAVVSRIDAAMESLIAVVATCARWGPADTDNLWKPQLMELTSQQVAGGTSAALDLRFYPATLLMYAVGVAMMEAGRLLELESLLRTTIPNHHTGKSHPISSELLAGRNLSAIQHQVPQDQCSEHVSEQVQTPLVEHLRMTPSAVEEAFEYLEYLIFLISADTPATAAGGSRSTGRIRNTGSFISARARPAAEPHRASASGQHPWIAMGLFGGDPERLSVVTEQFDRWFRGTHGFGLG